MLWRHACDTGRPNKARIRRTLERYGVAIVRRLIEPAEAFRLSVAVRQIFETKPSDHVTHAAPAFGTDDDFFGTIDRITDVLGVTGYATSLGNSFARLVLTTSQERQAGFHQDAVIGQNAAGLTVWIALSACGRDAPSLQFVPQRFERDASASDIEGSRYLRPRYKPGDATVFNAWTAHGTFFDTGMTTARTSLDLRFVPGCGG